MTERSRSDLAIIGAGSAAFAAAIRATSLGARVALIERGSMGGTCTNVGCIPSKHLLAASSVYRTAGDHPFVGVNTRQAGVDVPQLISAKAGVVSELRKEKYEDLVARYGFDVIHGKARFSGQQSLEVDGVDIDAEKILIATGSRPWSPPIDGLAESGYLTSTTAMEVSHLPESVVVIGGNSIGLELGQVFANLGSQVTIVEVLDRIAPLEEPEISQSMTQILLDQGIDVLTSADVERVEAGSPKVVHARVRGTTQRLTASEVLVATGRRPALEDLRLEQAGIDLDETGGLVLDETLRTTNPHVYAAGDVTGAPQFVYVAAAQGTVAADNAIGQSGRRMDYTAVPRVTFTTPNIASVGLTDREAFAAGFVCDCRILDLEHVPRARVSLETRGLFKIVADRSTGKILGVHVLAENAGDVILAGVYAVKLGLTVDDVASSWAPYLTMAEGMRLTAQSFTTPIEMLSCCAA